MTNKCKNKSSNKSSKKRLIVSVQNIPGNDNQSTWILLVGFHFNKSDVEDLIVYYIFKGVVANLSFEVCTYHIEHFSNF